MLLLVLGLQSLISQTEKGHCLIGGSIYGSKGLSNSNKNFTLGVQPSLGFFVADNLAIGASLSFNMSTAPNTPNFYGYGLGPLARYYVGGGKIKPFVSASAMYVGSNYDGQTSNGFNFDGGVGVAFFVTDNVAIDLQGLYKWNKFSGSSVSSYLYIPIGFQVVL